MKSEQNRYSAIALAESDRAEPILTLLDNMADVIHDSNTCIYGVEAWFKAYVSSQAFAELRTESKGEAFELVTNLKYVLQNLDEKMTDFKNSNY